MRKAWAILALAPALLAVPALAQSDAEPVPDSVERVDGTVDKAVDSANLTLATREQVRPGAEIHGPTAKASAPSRASRAIPRS